MDALYINLYMGNDSLTQVTIYQYSRLDKNIDKDIDKGRDRGGDRHKDMHMHMHIKFGDFDFFECFFGFFCMESHCKA